MNYEIRYLPSAKNDINNIIHYISEYLKATKAAMDLLDTLETSILGLQQFPYSCKVYQPIRSMEDEYRLLPVKNYAVLYVVTGNIVEIRRVVYAKMDLTKIQSKKNGPTLQ